MNAPVELFQEFVRSAYNQNLLQIQADEEKNNKEKEENKENNKQIAPQQLPIQSPSMNMEDIIDTLEEGG